MSDQAQRVPVLVESFDGSSSSDDGENIKVGVQASGGGAADVIIPVDRAADLLALVAAALGEAMRKQKADPKIRYYLPVAQWEMEPMQDPRILRMALRLPGGAEICFQIARDEAQHMRDALSVLLGADETPSPPRSRQH
jgi:hypothetical protein